MSRWEAAGSTSALHRGIKHDQIKEIQCNAAIAVDAFDSRTQI